MSLTDELLELISWLRLEETELLDVVEGSVALLVEDPLGYRHAPAMRVVFVVSIKDCKSDN